MAETEVIQYSGQLTLTNKVNGARDKTSFDFILLVSPKTYELKNNPFSSTPNDCNRNGQFCGRATLTNKVDGAYDKASFDTIEHIYPKTCQTNN